MPKTIDLVSKQSYLIQEYQNGSTFAKLGKEFGCSECTIRTFLKKHIEVRDNPKAPKNWQTKNEEITKLHSEGVSAYQMSIDLGIPLTTLARMLKKLNLDISHRSKIREDKMKDHEEEVIHRYLAGESEQSIADSFQCDNSTVSRILSRNEVPTRFHYTVDHNFFNKIDTEAKAYILGYFTADGCNYSQNNIVSITSVDLEILEKMKKEWKYTGPIYKGTVNKNFPDRKKTYILSISSKTMSDRLKLLGCDHRKTFTTFLPSRDLLPEYLLKHFIRGLCDGDGCLTYNNSNKCISIAGMKNLLEPIQEFINKELETVGGLFIHGNIFDLKYGGNIQALKVAEFLYKNSQIYLDRKHKIYQLWCKS